MKNLADNHLSIKQSVLNSLINSPDNSDTHYNNVRASLLNNGIVFPVPESFNANDFTTALKGFFESTLKTKTDEQTVGDDIHTLEFSPIGFGLMKKTVLYSVLDSHIYINIVPSKEIENTNYSEGMFSELISSGKSGQINSFVEDYILHLYPESIITTVKDTNRYYYSNDDGSGTLLAYHLEDGERILAKLDIYKVEATKSYQLSGETDRAFYLMTTNGSYLLITDHKHQEKYIEALSDETMVVHSRIGRDSVECGVTKWITERDNDFLFDEIQELNNETMERKLRGFAILHFNLAEKQSDKQKSAELMDLYANVHKSLFTDFAAELIRYSSQPADNFTAQPLMEKANSLFSETELERKLKQFLNDFKFSASEIVTLIFVISRVRNRIEDTRTFRDTLVMLKERYFKMDDNTLNRAFVEISIAKKLACVGERDEARTLTKNALGILTDQSLIRLLPVKDCGPDLPYSTAALYYAATEEMFKLSDNDSDRLEYAKKNAVEKPLIRKNLENLSKYIVDGSLKERVCKAMSIFDYTKFNTPSQETEMETCNIEKLSIDDMDESLKRGHTYSNLSEWIAKVLPDNTFASIKDHAEKVTADNYPALNTISEKLEACFGLSGVDIYVIENRNQGIFSNDDGGSKYIIVDKESLDNANANYMDSNELAYQLSKEYASLSTGISRLSSHLQWRNFNTVGITSTDIISQFAPASNYLEANLKNYSKLLEFSTLLTDNPEYYNFDIEDTGKASEMLEQTLSAISFRGLAKLDNIKEKEYAALTMLTDAITGRIALLLTDDIVSAIKSTVHNDRYIKGGAEFLSNNSVADLATCKTAEGKPINYDFLMKINSLVGFYLSDDYEALRKNIKKNS